MKTQCKLPNNFIIGNLLETMQTKAPLKKQASVALVYQLERKKIDEAIKDEFWVNTMKEELD